MTYDAEMLERVKVMQARALSEARAYESHLGQLVPEEQSTFDRGFQDLVYKINKMAQRALETLEARPR